MRCCSCGGDVVFDEGLQAYVCTSCGLVLEDRPILPDAPRFEEGRMHPEPRYSGAFTYRVHDRGVGGTEIPGGLAKHLREGRRWVARHLDILARDGKRLQAVLKVLNKVAKATGAPSAVVETAGRILAEYVAKKEVYRNAPAKKLAVASIYIAMKLHGYAVSPSELSEKTGLGRWDLWRGMRELYEVTGARAPALSTVDHVHGVAARIGADPETVALACNVLSAARETGLTSGLHPASLSAGALYLASVLVNRRTVQSTFKQVSYAAVRGALRRLVKALDIEVEL